MPSKISEHQTKFYDLYNRCYPLCDTTAKKLMISAIAGQNADAIFKAGGSDGRGANWDEEINRVYDFLLLFFGVVSNTETTTPSPVIQTTAGAAIEQNAKFHQPIFTLPLPLRVKNSLRVKEVHFLGQLVQMKEDELLKAPNLGPLGVGQIKDMLSGMGLDLGTILLDWKTPHPSQNNTKK